MAKAYYNEFDKHAAAWLRELIKEGHIAPGDVDERSIEDVVPTDLVGYTQCHFFAGIGVWSASLRAAGWPDNKPVWTGSCPCQPFSTAGQGEGFADERHLWPAWLHLIKHGKGPSVPILGEQVASDDGLTWLDLVQADMEGEAYSFRAVDLCAAGFGAPHIRQRFFFHAKPDGVAQGDTICKGLEGFRGHVLDGNEPGRIGAVEAGPTAEAGASGGLGNSEGIGRKQRQENKGEHGEGMESPERESLKSSVRSEDARGLADAGHDQCIGRDTLRAADGEHDGATGPGEGAGAERERPERDAAVRSTGGGMGNADSERVRGVAGEVRRAQAGESGRGRGDNVMPPSADDRPGPVNGFWRVADWLWCKDQKWRPVEPGTFPLVDGTPSRVVRLRGYGNAINKEVTTAFIKAVIG